MDLDQLIAFERIARRGSFSRAAWDLGIAQPSVSARIRALEAQLGGRLFVRRGRGVILTDRGASFLPYAQRAIEVLREGVEAAQQAHSGDSGRVTIGVLESLSGSFLGPALADFHRVRPQVEVLVRAGRQEHLIEMLRDGVITLALICWPCVEQLDLPMEPFCLLRERVLAAAAPTHPLAHMAPLDSATLLAHARPFLMLRWWPQLPPPIADLAARATAIMDVPMDSARHMLLDGAAVGFFPWMQVADALSTGSLVELTLRDLPPITRHSALVRLRRAAPIGAATLALSATVAAHARQRGILWNTEPQPGETGRP